MAEHAQSSQGDGTGFAAIHQESTGVQSNHLSTYCLLNYRNSRIRMTEGIYTHWASHLRYRDSTLTTTTILKIKLSTIHTEKKKKKKSCKSKCVENKLSSSIREAEGQRAAEGLSRQRWRTETGLTDPVALVQQRSERHSPGHAPLGVPRSTQRDRSVRTLTRAHMQQVRTKGVTHTHAYRAMQEGASTERQTEVTS